MQKVILNLMVATTFWYSLFVFEKEHNNEMKNQPIQITYISRKPKYDLENIHLLILLHGYGSNERDFFSLFKNVPENWMIVSIRGTNTIQNGQYCWYKVKMIDNKITINSEEEENSNTAITQFISQLTQQYKIDKNKIVLAGFSQGANMAESIALQNSNLISGFAVFSGRFLEEIKPKILPSNSFKKLKAFIAHGSSDKLLSKQYAIDNKNALEKLELQVNYSEDTSAHSISTNQFSDFLTWLKQF